MDNLTPEREKVIRDWPYLQTPPVMMWEASRELLAEIDRLRDDNKDPDQLSKVLLENKQLREKLAVAEEQINTLYEKVNNKLRSIMVGNYSYLVDSYRSQIASVFEEALSKIRGEK